MTALEPDLVLAAGAAVWCPTPTGPAICLVHRPRYDDWSLPKGKLAPGEHAMAAAVREVAEETGLDVTLGRPLPSQRYEARGMPKLVWYWLAQAGPDAVVRAARRPADAEVDQVVFVAPAEAKSRLTYERDVEVLQAALDGPLRTSALVILRHAPALPRSQWASADDERPLTDDGHTVAQRLVAPLSTLGIGRLISSDATRCLDTVRPLTIHLRLPIEAEPLISEDAAGTDAELADFGAAVLASGPVVVCSHRPVVPRLLTAVGVDPGEPLEPAEFVVAHHHEAHVIATERHQP